VILGNLLSRLARFGRLIGTHRRSWIQVRRPFERMGTEYDGYAVCPDGLGPDSVVYSIGVGEDISFDLEVIEKWGASVFAFDPTPRSIAWVRGQEVPSCFRFFEYGIAGFDGRATFSPPENPEHVSHTILKRSSTADRAISVDFRRLATVMDELGHDRIDVLKMDIEGAEYDVIDDIVKMNLDVGQFLIEFHGRFPGVGTRRTRRPPRRLVARDTDCSTLTGTCIAS